MRCRRYFTPTINSGQQRVEKRVLSLKDVRLETHGSRGNYQHAHEPWNALS